MEGRKFHYSGKGATLYSAERKDLYALGESNQLSSSAELINTDTHRN